MYGGEQAQGIGRRRRLAPGPTREPAQIASDPGPARRKHAMTEPAAPPGTTSILPPPSANGSAPPAPRAPARRRTRTKISSMRVALIAGTAVLIVVLIFIIQNAHAVSIS